jgi:Family of unknown function (DUF6065)/Cupin-like domain
MDLTCFLHPGWQPMIRPAVPNRDWMDGTPESFAYRCLPLNIANAHGWELLNPTAVDACWNGQSDKSAITITPVPDSQAASIATSLFGQGVLTFHIPGIFRTSPGWNLWIGGSPNRPKDGICPLTGVVETDWSPFTFTMNWRFTRPNKWIHFDAGEPICFFFPVQRALLDSIQPVMAPIDAEENLNERFQAWSNARDAFVRRVADEPPTAPADKWQKHYYRGMDMSEKEQIPDHRTRLRLKPFDISAISWPMPSTDAFSQNKTDPPPKAEPAVRIGEEDKDSQQCNADQALLDLRKREWLLEALEGLRSLSPRLATIERRANLNSEEFLDRYFAANRPVILTGEMSDWPALAKWTPDYLKRAVGSELIEFQGNRNRSSQFEIFKDAHRREMPFDQFIDLISQPGAGNDAYLTAYNSARNTKALSKLFPDLGFPDKFLTHEAENPNGMMWVGPSGTLTSLHHDLTNNLIAQVLGRKRLLILPASEVGKLYNHFHVFSEITDLEDPALSPARFPRLEQARFAEITLMPGEMIFMPLAWWHQVRAVDFSVTITYTNFRWPNGGYLNFPSASSI